MTEPKQKKDSDSNVRLPAEVIADLRKIAATQQLQGMAKPVFGDLLLEAWRFYKSAHLKDSPAGHTSAQLVSTDSREPTVNKHGQRRITVVESEKSTASAVIEITPGEWTWVIRFLNILRSGTIAARAIKWNILTFSKVMGDQGDATDSPIPRPRLSAKDLERIRRQARTVEQALESEDEDGTKHQAAGARRGGTQG